MIERGQGREGIIYSPSFLPNGYCLLQEREGVERDSKKKRVAFSPHETCTDVSFFFKISKF